MSLLVGNSTVYSNVGIVGDGTHPTVILRYGYVAGASGTANTISYFPQLRINAMVIS